MSITRLGCKDSYWILTVTIAGVCSNNVYILPCSPASGTRGASCHIRSHLHTGPRYSSPPSHVGSWRGSCGIYLCILPTCHHVCTPLILFYLIPTTLLCKCSTCMYSLLLHISSTEIVGVCIGMDRALPLNIVDWPIVTKLLRGHYTRSQKVM